MSIEKQVIIHTGFHKTGSSSVQHSLAHNRPLLKEHGYYYPDITLQGKVFYNRSVPLYGRYCDHPEKFQHYGYHNELDADFANREIDKIFNTAIWNQDKLIFSDEFISSLSSNELMRLRDDFQMHGYKIRVISYIRDPFNLMVSVAQQQSRRSSVHEIISGKRSNQEIEKIQRLIDIFNDDAEFYNFEKACQHTSGPAGFLFGLIGIELPTAKAMKVNEGMSAQAVRLLSYINREVPLMAKNSTINPIRKKFDVAPLFKIPGDKFQLTSVEVGSITPKINQARKDISEMLGHDFLPPVDFKFCDTISWGVPQLEHLYSIRHSLDLQLLIHIHDFLSGIEISNESASDKQTALTIYTRDRLNKELTKNEATITFRKPAHHGRAYRLIAPRYKRLLAFVHKNR